MTFRLTYRVLAKQLRYHSPRIIRPNSLIFFCFTFYHFIHTFFTFVLATGNNVYILQWQNGHDFVISFFFRAEFLLPKNGIVLEKMFESMEKASVVIVFFPEWRLFISFPWLSGHWKISKTRTSFILCYYFYRRGCSIARMFWWDYVIELKSCNFPIFKWSVEPTEFLIWS